MDLKMLCWASEKINQRCAHGLCCCVSVHLSCLGNHLNRSRSVKVHWKGTDKLTQSATSVKWNRANHLVPAPSIVFRLFCCGCWFHALMTIFSFSKNIFNQTFLIQRRIHRNTTFMPPTRCCPFIWNQQFLHSMLSPSCVRRNAWMETEAWVLQYMFKHALKSFMHDNLLDNWFREALVWWGLSLRSFPLAFKCQAMNWVLNKQSNS